MTQLSNMWGIHNDALGAELFEEGFISIGWEEMPDLRTVGDDRARMKEAVAAAYPSAKAGAIPIWAGVMLRFAFEMQLGDVVVAPYRADSTLNFGVVDGQYEYHEELNRHPHRRRVRWMRTGVARALFPQTVLYEVGSAVTLFQVRTSAETFRKFLASESDANFAEAATREVPEVENAVAWAADEPNADRIDQYSRDFVAQTLLTELSHEEFEHFIADLLRTLGYQARVTPYVADGGIDVVAHRDPLGLEPPIIKVQCKHTTSTQSRPDVQRLIGTLSAGEFGLFVSLGGYSKDALDLERERQNLRLFTGTNITELTLANYNALPPQWRGRLPLRRVLVVDRAPEAS
jgi:restriction system protein